MLGVREIIDWAFEPDLNGGLNGGVGCARKARLFAVSFALLAGMASATLPQESKEGEASPATTRLTVRVKEKGGGQRIGGATIEIQGAARASKVTDAEGVAVFDDLERGRISIRVSKEDWKAIRRTLRLHAERQQISLELSPWAVLTVRVIGLEEDGERAPVVGCRVELTRDGGTTTSRRTDTSGTARFDALTRGEEVAIRVVAQSWETGFKRRVLTRLRESVEIELAKRQPAPP